MINLLTAENTEGRIDVARAAGSAAMTMFVYDLAPGESSSPYHYEYEEEWLLVVEGTLVVRVRRASARTSEATSCASRRGRRARTRS